MPNPKTNEANVYWLPEGMAIWPSLRLRFKDERQDDERDLSKGMEEFERITGLMTVACLKPNSNEPAEFAAGRELQNRL